MNSREIGQWCLDNKKYLYGIILKHDKNMWNLEDNYNHLVVELMKKCQNFNSNKGVKFITYVYRIAHGVLGKYILKKRLTLSYPDWVVSTPKGRQLITDSNIESTIQGGLGFNPDIMESKMIDINFKDIDLEYDKKELIDKVNKIIDNKLPKQQKIFMRYRYNYYLEPVHTLTDYSKAFGVTVQAGKNNEVKAIKNIRKILGVDI